MNTEPTHDLLINELQLSAASQQYLSVAAKWGKFLAIIGFIFSGLITTMGFFMGPLLAKYMRSGSLSYSYLSPLLVTGIYIFLAVVFFFPCLNLFRFSGKIQDALDNNNQESLDSAFLNLKSIFKFYGIVTIIVLSFYMAVFIVSLVIAATR
ncbi:MAG: DUF5362 family protein [Ginsengibacter sp.]